MSNAVQYIDMKDSGIKWIGSVPASWNVRTLYQLATRVNNKNSDLAEQNLLSLSYGKIKRKDINTNDGLLPASFDGYNIIEAGDIVLRLTDLQNDHTSLRVGHATERGIITSAYTTLRPINPAHSRYLYYLIHAFDLKKGFYGMGSGVRQGLNYDEVKELRVVLPPQKEQDIIVGYLDDQCAEIDALIKETKGNVENYRQWKVSLIFQTITSGKTVCESKKSDIPWANFCPLHWKILPLKRVITARDGGAWGEEKGNDPNDRICMRIADFAFDQGRFTRLPIDQYTSRNYTNAQIEKLYLKYGDILVEKSGGGEKTPVGRSVMYDLPFDALFANFMDRLRVDAEMILPEYFEYFWRGMYARAVTIPYIKQTTGIQNLNLSGLLNSESIIIPPIDEQLELVRYLDTLCSQLDTIIDVKMSLISDLDLFKRSLIYETITGKRKVV